jgi:hypothetical protein
VDHKIGSVRLPVGTSMKIMGKIWHAKWEMLFTFANGYDET